MLSNFDKELLNVIQTNLPIDKRPFLVLADRLGVSEQQVLERMEYLKAQGFLRRIGPFFDSHRLGYAGTLAAVRVQPEKMAEVAAAINAISGVTHNYEREGEFNLWFTLLTTDEHSTEIILDRVRRLPGVLQLMNLPATEKFKVNVQFKLG